MVTAIAYAKLLLSTSTSEHIWKMLAILEGIDRSTKMLVISYLAGLIHLHARYPLYINPACSLQTPKRSVRTRYHTSDELSRHCHYSSMDPLHHSTTESTIDTSSMRIPMDEDRTVISGQILSCDEWQYRLTPLAEHVP